MRSHPIGIDFGTTNSSIARANSSGEIELAHFPMMDRITDSYRSLLYLEHHKETGINLLKSWTGPEAIEHYLAAERKGRLIQSLKSFLSSRSLQSTEIFGRRHTIEDLIARILKDLREKAEKQFGIKIRSAMVGRPVQFVGAESNEDNDYAEARLKKAFEAAGYESIEFEMEPVAAAHYYESSLDHDELILIGDFGGGTSDFSLLRVGPGVHPEEARVKKARIEKAGLEKVSHNRETSGNILGNAGIGVAGDAFDAKIIKNLVSPALGAGTQMRSMGKLLPVPSWIYTKLERWHHLSFLRAKEVMDLLKTVRSEACEPEKIAALIYLIKEDLGFQLHGAVQQLKFDLSANPSAKFKFSDGMMDIEAIVKRSSFEHWIAEDLAKIESCIDSLLKSANVSRKAVDAVFLTGGSSFVPAVKRIFETRFGANRIRTGDEFTSVARGLALTARDRNTVHR
jgi:hypothetical chaperone protein